MNGYIDGYNFKELEAMKYFAPPASWSQDKKKANVRDKIFSGEWYGAEKKDGYFTKIVKDEDGEVGLYSRSRNVNGEYVDKKEWVPHLAPFFEKLPNGTCILGELYLPSKPGSRNVTTILGCLKDKAISRQEKGEKLFLYVFDVLAFGESRLGDTFDSRATTLRKIEDFYLTEYVSFAHYVNGQELWDTLQEVLARGDEGVVITHKDAKYEPGKRPSKTTLKVKKELQETIDCVILGANEPTRLYSGGEIKTWKYWENVMTGERYNEAKFDDYENGAPIEPVTKAYFNDWAGSLIIGARKGDKLVPIGSLSGVTEEILSNWKQLKGRVIEVTAMEIMKDTKGLRHPKFLQFRDDLLPRDTDWNRIFGDE